MKTMNDMINGESCTAVGSVLPEQTDRFAPTGWVCPTCKRVYSPFTFIHFPKIRNVKCFSYRNRHWGSQWKLS